jgi:hypothetical protein
VLTSRQQIAQLDAHGASPSVPAVVPVAKIMASGPVSRSLSIPQAPTRHGGVGDRRRRPIQEDPMKYFVLWPTRIARPDRGERCPVRLDLAEDALSEAFARASDRWPVIGVPANPAWWPHSVRSRCVFRPS